MIWNDMRMINWMRMGWFKVPLKEEHKTWLLIPRNWKSRPLTKKGNESEMKWMMDEDGLWDEKKPLPGQASQISPYRIGRLRRKRVMKEMSFKFLMEVRGRQNKWWSIWERSRNNASVAQFRWQVFSDAKTTNAYRACHHIVHHVGESWYPRYITDWTH